MYHKKPKRPNPYKAANEAFLEAKSKEEGIVTLDNGVLYWSWRLGTGPRNRHRAASFTSIIPEGSSTARCSTPRTETSSPRCSWSATSSWDGRSSLRGCMKVTNGRFTSRQNGAMDPQRWMTSPRTVLWSSPWNWSRSNGDYSSSSNSLICK